MKEPRVVKDISALPRLQISSAFVWDEDEIAEPTKGDDSSSSDSEEETVDDDKTVVKDRRERAKQKLEQVFKLMISSIWIFSFILFLLTLQF